MDNEFKYLFWTELHYWLTKLSQWVTAKQAQAARVYLPQVKQVWYDQAVESGILQAMMTAARELGEESVNAALRTLHYTWRIGEVCVFVDEGADSLTVHVGEQLVCSTEPTLRLFIPGQWLHILAPYLERAQIYQEAWTHLQSQWDYRAS